MKWFKKKSNLDLYLKKTDFKNEKFGELLEEALELKKEVYYLNMLFEDIKKQSKDIDLNKFKEDLKTFNLINYDMERYFRDAVDREVRNFFNDKEQSMVSPVTGAMADYHRGCNRLESKNRLLEMKNKAYEELLEKYILVEKEEK